MPLTLEFPGTLGVPGPLGVPGTVEGGGMAGQVTPGMFGAPFIGIPG